MTKWGMWGFQKVLWRSYMCHYVLLHDVIEIRPVCQQT